MGKKSLFVVSLSNKPSHDSLGHFYEKRLPGLHMCAFIDGLYLWAKCTQADSLVPNLGSNGWPGTKPFQVAMLCHKPYLQKKGLKELLPELSMCETVVVLGARLQTTLKKSFEWPRAKTIKILRDLEVVKTIPSSRMIHERLISTQVVPQLSFFTHINLKPKPVLTKVQNHIADALWKGRPS